MPRPAWIRRWPPVGRVEHWLPAGRSTLGHLDQIVLPPPALSGLQFGTSIDLEGGVAGAGGLGDAPPTPRRPAAQRSKLSEHLAPGWTALGALLGRAAIQAHGLRGAGVRQGVGHRARGVWVASCAPHLNSPLPAPCHRGHHCPLAASCHLLLSSAKVCWAACRQQRTSLVRGGCATAAPDCALAQTQSVDLVCKTAGSCALVPHWWAAHRLVPLLPAFWRAGVEVIARGWHGPR